MFLAMIIGGAKGFTGLGIILGLALGPLGVLIVSVMKATPEVQARREAAVEAARMELRSRSGGTPTHTG